jgi:16S rRNA (guanine966-N2)-methyltransferase
MKKHLSPAKSSKSPESGQFRIIGGSWRSRKLQFPAVEGLRPTPDRVRETLFNWLFDTKGLHCLDLFAGAGSLGLEALSRGAEHCLFIDKSAAACNAINNHLALLQGNGKALHNDVLTAISALPKEQKFNLIFIDPPYKDEIVSKCLLTLKDLDLLANDAAIYIESDSNKASCSLPEGFSVLKEKIQGQVRFSLLSFSSAN